MRDLSLAEWFKTARASPQMSSTCGLSLRYKRGRTVLMKPWHGGGLNGVTQKKQGSMGGHVNGSAVCTETRTHTWSAVYMRRQAAAGSEQLCWHGRGIQNTWYGLCKLQQRLALEACM